MRLLFVGIIVLFQSSFCFSQTKTSVRKGNRGRIYIYWGWNRGWFTNSDIRFKGKNYDFTLKNVEAKDRQTPFDANLYLNPGNMSIPQTDFRLGYYFNDHWNISFGIDHMKYVMQQDQEVAISGYIEKTETKYDHIYNNNDKIVLTTDFLMFEHTNGLNYVNIETRRSDHLLTFNKIDVNALAGVGAGILYPRTNTKLINYERYDEFHVAGYGLGAVTGINFIFWNIFFLQTELKGGFIDMPDIRTTNIASEKVSQHFFFLQHNYELGLSIKLSK